MAETIHATAVLAGTRGLLVRGPSGSGKSRLAHALMQRGARLVADDRVHLAACGGRLIASAPGSIAGLLELRGRGPVKVSHERSCVVHLIVDVVSGDTLERVPEEDHMRTEMLGISVLRQPVAANLEQAVALVDAALGGLSSNANMGLRTTPVWR